MENETSSVSNPADFYQQCADILQVPHNYVEPVSRRTRWNNRHPGNGRYEGYGLIRRYNASFIHVHFGTKGSAIYRSENEVFEFLKKLKQNT